jgi:hypothetical protein
MKLRHLLFVAGGLSLGACNGPVITGHGSTKREAKALPATAFDKIEISAPVDAHISVGGGPSLSLEGFANLLPYIHTEVRNGTLRIFTDDITELNTDKNIIANITLPSLAGLQLNGSSDAIVSGAVNARDFDLGISGSGGVDIKELHVQSFKADLSGSAELNLGAGDIGDGSFQVSGSGEIKAFGVSQRQASLDIAGSGEAEVSVADQLKIEVSGAGSVAYKGHPRITQDISGSGDIKDAN